MTAAEIIDLERGSIREYVDVHSHYLQGDVLDYGCGLSPYKDIVERAGGTYFGFDRVTFPANVSGENVGGYELLQRTFDAVLCNQVLQYVESPLAELHLMRARLLDRGHLVITGPTTWREIERADLWRFTTRGIEQLLITAGFDLIELSSRGQLELGSGFPVNLGWGAVAQRVG